MSASLKYQMISLLRNIGVSSLTLAVFIPYIGILGGSLTESAAVFYEMITLLMLFMFCFMLPWTGACIQFRLALGFGATRRGWFFASALTKVLSAVALSAITLFVFHPLARLVYGEGFRIALQPTLLELNGFRLSMYLPAFLLLCVAASCIGEMFGFIMSRYNGKVMVVILVAFMVVLVMALLIAFSHFGLASAIGVLLSHWVLVVLGVVIAASLGASWLLIKKQRA